MDTILNRRTALKLAAGAAGIYAIYPGRRTFAAASEYNLAVEKGRITVDGISSRAKMMGGSVPAPTLHWREGEEVVIHATNRMDEPTSIHWHGLLLVGVMDGAPGFNGYVAIQPGETYTYRFRLRQSGTYWYHSHSAMQEQMGMYGAIVIAPKEPETAAADRDYVVVLSDHTREDPRRVFANLKADAGYYNRGKRTLLDFFRDAKRDGLDATIKDRKEWGDMRMDPTQALSARVAVNEWGEEELGRALRDLGEERHWRRLAGRIVQFRAARGGIETTGELVEALGAKGWKPYHSRRGRGRGGGRRAGPALHPATRTFQALRIAVNEELQSVESALPAAIDALAPGGRLGVISFHSLEDRLVKWAFRKAAGQARTAPLSKQEKFSGVREGPDVGGEARVRILTKRPLTAAPEEVAENPRSRSAKLRVVEKL